MTELLLTKKILNSFYPLKNRGKVKRKREVKVGNNIADIVYYQRSGGNDYQKECIVAIEVKIKNWKRALQQAYRNKLFADYAYVALPKKFSTPAITNIKTFRQAGVGLLVIQENNIKTYYTPPKKCVDHIACYREKVRGVFY